MFSFLFKIKRKNEYNDNEYITLKAARIIFIFILTQSYIFFTLSFMEERTDRRQSTQGPGVQTMTLIRKQIHGHLGMHSSCEQPQRRPAAAGRKGEDTPPSEAHMWPAAQDEAGFPWGRWRVREPSPE